MLSYLRPQIYGQHLSLKEGFLRHEYNPKTNNSHRILGNSLRKVTKIKWTVSKKKKHHPCTGPFFENSNPTNLRFGNFDRQRISDWLL